LCLVGGLEFVFPFFSFGIDELRAEKLNVSESGRVDWNLEEREEEQDRGTRRGRRSREIEEIFRAVTLKI